MSKTTTTTEEFDAEGNLLKRTVEVWEDEPTEEPAKPFLKDLGSDLPETRPKAKGGLIEDDYLELTEGHWIPRPDKYPYAPCNIHAMRMAKEAGVAYQVFPYNPGMVDGRDIVRMVPSFRTAARNTSR